MKSGKVVEKFKNQGQEIIFRYPKSSDLKDLLELVNTLVKERVYTASLKKKTLREEKIWLENLLRDIEQRKVVHLEIEVEGKIRGNANIRQAGYDVQKHVGTFGIILRQEIRNRGISQKLFKALVSEAKKFLKLKILKLTVFALNKRAIAFYKKIGFKKVGLIKRGFKHYGRYADEIIMVKYL